VVIQPYSKRLLALDSVADMAAPLSACLADAEKHMKISELEVQTKLERSICANLIPFLLAQLICVIIETKGISQT
jgi:hypothetical protein